MTMNAEKRVGRRKESAYYIILVFIFLCASPVSSISAMSFTIMNLTATNPVTTGYTQFSELQINDAGQVAFIGSNPALARSDVFFWDGTVMTNITKDDSAFAGFVSASNLRLNQNGEIAFVGSGPD